MPQIMQNYVTMQIKSPQNEREETWVTVTVSPWSQSSGSGRKVIVAAEGAGAGTCVGASEGFLGWIAYLGAANAGVPLSMLVQQFGWGAFFVALLSACAVAIALLAPITGAQSEVQRAAKAAAR